jgi:flavin reductase (DIM6/NTAB) family NADH-FMN oxidoreductase RutF
LHHESALSGSVFSLDLKLAEVSPHERYKLLIGLVIPRPIAWISTRSQNGVANCAPFSFFNVFSEDPPLCVIGINPRSDGALKHSLKNIRRTGEFVVNLVDEASANAMHVSSREFGEDESEFEHAGLTEAPSLLVEHPRIAEAAACLECRVERLLHISGTRELVLGEILLVHAREGIIDPATKRISEELYRPVGRLFANRYCTTRQRFDLPGELPK